MAGCEEISFSGVTREHVQEFLQKGEQIGLPGLAGQGDHGEVSHSGVTVRWDYRPEARVLVVQCTKAPMLFPCALINTRIKEVLAMVVKQDTAREQA